MLDPTATFAATTTTVTAPTTATPVISPGTGTYGSGQSVTITDGTTGAAIYYTLDGTTPSASSTLYAGAFQVASSLTVNAIAVAGGYLSSGTATATYNIFVPIPTSLSFVQQPTTSATGIAIAPAVAVAILDQNGNTITGSTAGVTLRIGTNAGNGTLAGNTSANAVNGIATFSNLSITSIANGYTLVASSNGLPNLTSSAFNITPYPISVSLFAPLLGVASTLPGTFTLSQPAPAGGVTVNLASSVPANVTVSPATVAVAAGQTTGSFTYTGVAPGASNITASATNYLTGSATVTATYSLVSLGTIPSVAPAQSVSIALSIGTAAPAGGLTVSFTSSNPNVATVTSSVFIPAGLRTAATNPQIVGLLIGSTMITATAPGYAPDARTVPVTVVASFSPSTISIAHQTYSTVTLNISAPAQTGGLTFSLSSDAPATATVPASVTIPAGQTSVVVPLTGVADASTTIRADSPGVAEATMRVTVSSVLALYYGNSSTGVNMQAMNYVQPPSAPATATTIAVTSSNPAVATVSSSATTVGTPSITYPNVTTAAFNAVYFQGQSVGTATITMSAPGYTTSTNTVTVTPSGFVITGNAVNTTTFSGPTTVYVYPYILNANLSPSIYGTLNPGLANISLPISSSNTATGTITTSPIIIPAGATSASTTFQPVNAGTSTLSIGTPTGVSGFSIPTSSQSVSATVTAPQLSIYYGSTIITGVNMMIQDYGQIPVAPPSAETFTITSSNPAVATVSATATAVGTASITYPNTSTAALLGINVQGQSAGTSTITFSAPGYTSGTATVTVYPSGFTLGSSSISTTTFSPATNVAVYPTILNPTTLNYYTTGTLNPGLASINVPVASSNTNVGTITTSPIVFAAGSGYGTTTFQPNQAGTSTVSVGTPSGVSGFSTPATNTSLTATVTAPQLSFYYGGSNVTGVSMQISNYIYVPSAPPTATTYTITSSNPAVAVVSTVATAMGGSSVMVPNQTGSGAVGLFYIQGLTTGTTTLTVSGNGFTSGTLQISVYPSGFIINTSSITTTTFSSASSVFVSAEVLNPSSLTPYTSGTLNPGVGPVSLTVSSSNTNVGTIAGSPVSIAGGTSSGSVSFQPSSAGTSTVSLATPQGFSTPANQTSITATVSAPQLAFNGANITGLNMEVSTLLNLPVAPPNAVNVTITSNGPGIVTLSTSPTAVGTTSITFANVTAGGYLPTIYVQGQGIGSTTLTATAAGYTNGIVNITVYPSGFTFDGNYSNGISTTSTAGATALPVYPTILNPGTLSVYATAQLNPGLGGTGVAVTSSNTNAGTITTSPVVFSGGETYGYIYTSFKPVATGSTNINIVQPQGYSTPSQYITIPATVQ